MHHLPVVIHALPWACAWLASRWNAEHYADSCHCKLDTGRRLPHRLDFAKLALLELAQAVRCLVERWHGPCQVLLGLAVLCSALRIFQFGLSLFQAYEFSRFVCFHLVLLKLFHHMCNLLACLLELRSHVQEHALHDLHLHDGALQLVHASLKMSLLLLVLGSLLMENLLEEADKLHVRAWCHKHMTLHACDKAVRHILCCEMHPGEQIHQILVSCRIKLHAFCGGQLLYCYRE
mmetsp:Transcript_19325/g.34475  ORF Transcript_19325/g.34475 Transcript_19325/m.34475 type:complete len:234 (+) Transcript_19325:167-868(+)